jgi:hypothetical protein
MMNANRFKLSVSHEITKTSIKPQEQITQQLFFEMSPGNP